MRIIKREIWSLSSTVVLLFSLLFLITNVTSQVNLSVETVDASAQPERIFKSGNDIFIRTIIKNVGTTTVSGNLNLKIRDENGNVIETLPTVSISLSAGEQKIVNSIWKNSASYSNWTSPGGFTFVGKKFDVLAQFGTYSSAFPFYVDEFGVDKDFRHLTYYPVPWESVWGKIKSRINNGESVRNAWRNEWESVVTYAKGLGTNVFDIGMNWYSYGYDESCVECTNDLLCVIGNAKPLSYWFPASGDGNSYYSTPPMFPSVRRSNFQDIGISDIQTARQMIREISNIAHSHGMEVVVYLDPIGLYDPNHIFGCKLNPNNFINNIGWIERDGNGSIRRLDFCESNLNPAFPYPNQYAVVASPSGNSSTNYADEHSGFSPAVIDSDLSKGENWSDPSYHYHIAKQFRWLAKNYDFDIFFIDDTGRLITGCLGSTGNLNFGSDEKCTTTLTHLAKPSETPVKNYNGSISQTLKQRLENEYGTISDDDFTLDVYANMLRHMRWQLKDISDKKALFSGDYFVPWPSLVASEDASVTDQFTTEGGELTGGRGCHYIWADETYNKDFKPLRPAHYKDPVNSVCINDICIPRDARVVAGFTWAARGINIFNYPDLSPYSTEEDEVAINLRNYLYMYNHNTKIFSDPNLELEYEAWVTDCYENLSNRGRYKTYPKVYGTSSISKEEEILQLYQENYPELGTDSAIAKSNLITLLKGTSESGIATSSLPPENESLIEVIQENMYKIYPDLYSDPNKDFSPSTIKENSICRVVGADNIVYSTPLRSGGKSIVIHTVQRDLLGKRVDNSFYLVPALVQLPSGTKDNQIKIGLLTGDRYQGNIETDLTKTTLWYRADSNGNKVQNGDYLSIDIPTKVYSVLVVDIEPSAIWNPGSDNCYSAPLIPTENIESHDLSLQGRSYGWYRLNVTEGSAVYLDVPDGADYDMYVSNVCNGNHLWDLNENDIVKGCSYVDGNGLNERCSIYQPGTYYLELAIWGGKGEYKLYFGADVDRDGVPDFIDKKTAMCSDADMDNDNAVSDFELLVYVDLWANGVVDDFDLLSAIDDWVKGSCSLRSYAQAAVYSCPDCPKVYINRTMPESADAGTSFTVNLGIDVLEDAKPSAIIVIDQIPSGWNVTSSAPAADYFDNGVVKWMFKGGNVSDKNLSYTVKIPIDKEGNISRIRGQVLYKDQDSDVAISIAGNSEIEVKSSGTSGCNPPATGNWTVNQFTRCWYQSISVQIGKSLLLYNNLSLENTNLTTSRIVFRNASKITLKNSKIILKPA